MALILEKPHPHRLNRSTNQGLHPSAAYVLVGWLHSIEMSRYTSWEHHSL